MNAASYHLEKSSAGVPWSSARNWRACASKFFFRQGAGRNSEALHHHLTGSVFSIDDGKPVTADDPVE